MNKDLKQKNKVNGEARQGELRSKRGYPGVEGALGCKVNGECSAGVMRYIHALYEQKAFQIKEEPFTLHHGGESHLFLNHSVFLAKAENLALLAELYEGLIPSDLKEYKLGAVDSVMSPIITGMLVRELEKDVLVVKEKKLEHGLQNKIYGNTDGEVVLVDDVTTTGTILIKSAESLREAGAVVNYALLSACRDDAALKNLAEANITPLYVATYEEIIRELWDTLTEAEQKIVKKEIRNKNYNWNL